MEPVLDVFKEYQVPLCQDERYEQFYTFSVAEDAIGEHPIVNELRRMRLTSFLGPHSEYGIGKEEYDKMCDKSMVEIAVD